MTLAASFAALGELLKSHPFRFESLCGFVGAGSFILADTGSSFGHIYYI